MAIYSPVPKADCHTLLPLSISTSPHQNFLIFKSSLAKEWTTPAGTSSQPTNPPISSFTICRPAFFCPSEENRSQEVRMAAEQHLERRLQAPWNSNRQRWPLKQGLFFSEELTAPYALFLVTHVTCKVVQKNLVRKKLWRRSFSLHSH